MKKYLFILTLLSLIPLIGWAQGLVPCGGPGQSPCGFCDVFVLINNVVSFFLIPNALNKGAAIVPLIGTLMIVIGGFFLMTASGDPNRLQRGRSILFAALIGFVIVYGAWMFLNFGLEQFGIVQLQGLEWWQLECR